MAIFDNTARQSAAGRACRRTAESCTARRSWAEPYQFSPVGLVVFGGNGSETSLIYYDAAAKQIRWTMVSSGGTLTQSVVYKKEGKWSQKGHGSLPDGTKTHYTNSATISDDGNTWTWIGSGAVGNKATADQHDVWHRVSK